MLKSWDRVELQSSQHQACPSPHRVARPQPGLRRRVGSPSLGREGSVAPADHTQGLCLAEFLCVETPPPPPPLPARVPWFLQGPL